VLSLDRLVVVIKEVWTTAQTGNEFHCGKIQIATMFDKREIGTKHSRLLGIFKEKKKDKDKI
jgi:hypothetical protein